MNDVCLRNHISPLGTCTIRISLPIETVKLLAAMTTVVEARIGPAMSSRTAHTKPPAFHAGRPACSAHTAGAIEADSTLSHNFLPSVKCSLRYEQPARYRGRAHSAW